MALAVLAGCDRADDREQLLGTLERDRIELVAEAAEPIVELRVREGDRVHAGDVLARQETATSAARLAQADARIAEARERLAELEHGARPEDREAARARVAGAEAQQRHDAQEFARQRDLAARGLTSTAALDAARAARDASDAALRASRASLAELEHGTRPEQLAQAQAALAAAESARLELAVSGDRLEIRATRDGRVEALPYKAGERPPAGAPIVILAADMLPFARVYVPEPLRASVRPGTAAQVFVDGQPAPFTGRVRWVASEASFTPYYALTQRDRSRLTFLAEVDLTDGAAAALPSGVPVQVTLASPGP